MTLMTTYFVIGASILVLLLLDDWWSNRTKSDADIFLVTNRQKTKDVNYWIELAARLILGPIAVVVAWPYVLLFFGLNWRRERRNTSSKGP